MTESCTDFNSILMWIGIGLAALVGVACLFANAFLLMRFLRDNTIGWAVKKREKVERKDNGHPKGLAILLNIMPYVTVAGLIAIAVLFATR